MNHLCRFLSILLFAYCQACSTLPSLENRKETKAVLDTDKTLLGKSIIPVVKEHPGKSGIHELPDPQHAFAARMQLIQMAQRTLDLQYYIWHADITGTALFAALQSAANRGVRVRILLDDLNTAGMDTALALVDAHPNIELRLFNPFVIRSPRFWSLITDFSRLNRRMHNKSFTADSQATIIGGRNIGDEYFGATDNALFADLDVLAIGPVVKDVSKVFDDYWDSASSYPADRILPPADPALVKNVMENSLKVESSDESVEFSRSIEASTFAQELSQGRMRFEWAKTRVVSDAPIKGLGEADNKDLVKTKLQNILGENLHSMILISPYFVPTNSGIEALTNYAASGAKIKILTNALEATDVTAVHAGYAKSREPLLKAGIELYEFRRLPDTPSSKKSGIFKSSNTSLHAKTFSVDSDHVFIGSFNSDPRSIDLNTEMGFVIDSPVLARQIEEAFIKQIPEYSYELKLSPDGEIQWISRRGGQQVLYDSEPGANFWKSFWIGFLSILPIDWLL